MSDADRRDGSNPALRGRALLANRFRNKGTAFTDDELAESPVFSSLVEEKDVAADR